MKTIFLALLFSLIATVAIAKGTLILIVDKSASIRDNEMRLMTESYSKALTELSILDGVHVEVIFFADKAINVASGTAKEVAPIFSEYIEVGTNTCLEYALGIVIDNFETYEPPVVIDISADGEANCYHALLVPSHLDKLEELGATINTLYVRNSEYQTVFPDWKRGPDSFSIVAGSYYDFEEAIFQKLAREIALFN